MTSLLEEKYSVLKQRVITAVMLIAGFLLLLFNTDPLWFSVVVVAVVLLAGWEWCTLAAIKTSLGKFFYLATLLLCLLGSALWLNLFDSIDMLRGQHSALLASILWAIIFLWVQGYPSSAILWSSKPVLIILGLLLLTATWLAIVLIVHQPQGQWLLLLAVGVVAVADIGGYVAGNLLGKHKLAPVVSPGKTWEGFFGGLFFQLLLIIILIAVMPVTVSWLTLLLLVIPVSLYSVLGDLFESMLKRHQGVKDSSQILPGHGGVLDRIDGLMAALPLFILLYFLLSPL
jgi:phosphatidate cytidylyltransferase|tara:strand:- start:7289 stop:8149 length:861 start_codon:yes stop_codon:yes gene_type:complete